MLTRAGALLLAGAAIAACGSERPPYNDTDTPTPAMPPGQSNLGRTPRFGPTVTQADPPPALGAATLIVSRDRHTAIATDPDRDRVVIVDTDAREVRAVALAKGSEPGR